MIVATCKKEGKPFKNSKVTSALPTTSKAEALAMSINSFTDPNISGYKRTILGLHLQNPYKVSNMQAAWFNLTGQTCTLTPTHRYVRFLPTDLDELKAIEQLGYDMFDYPLDYEIVEPGNFYQDSSTSTLEDFTYLYTSIPYSTSLPSGMEVEELYNLYIPPEIGIVEGCNNSSLYAEDLEEEAYRLTGNLPADNGGGGSGNKKQSFFPEGFIKVKNTQFASPVPVRNVRVVSNNFGKMWYDFTDDQGHFKINLGYKNKVDVHVRFFNDNAHVRGLRKMRVWETGFSVHSFIGNFTQQPLQQIDHTFFSDPLDNLSAKQMDWVAALTINNISEYFEYSNNANIGTPPQNLNVWLTVFGKQGSLGATPMINKMLATSVLNQFFNFIIVHAGNTIIPGSGTTAVAIKKVIEKWLPDMVLNYEGSPGPSDQWAWLCYHELGHATHYNLAGNVFWSALVGLEAEHLASSLGDDPYGTRADFGHQQIELCEGWADYVGHLFADARYGGLHSLGGGTSWKTELEWFGNANAHFPESSGGMMYDYTEEGELNPAITDDVTDYTLKKNFDALNAGITSPLLWKNNLLMQNQNLQVTYVNNCFSSYGF